MTSTQFVPFEGETFFLAPTRDFLLETVLQPEPVVIRMPVIKIPRSVTKKYNDSELSTAARMLEKLRKRQDVIAGLEGSLPGRLDQDKALDGAVEKLIDKIV